MNDLQALTLANTRLTSFPNALSRLAGLKQLNLSNNPVGTLSEEICELVGLETLWLYKTGIHILPEGFPRFRNLKIISLGGNGLSSWPDPILELEELAYLNLGLNQITAVPSSIFRLKRLTFLDLSYNQISTIPPEICDLPSLKTLNLDHNPITSPQPEVIAGGLAAIQEYFSALHDSPSGRLFEAKLIVVGGGEVGKTCLANKLVDPEFDLKAVTETPTTRGIDIKPWRTETTAASDFKINIWDFGGQEIYHATHQFFLTKRSLYIFVWDARREDRVEVFDYWLNIVKLLSDGSPVLIVLNKADIRIKEIDQKSLKEKFPNIEGFHKVSALTGYGMPELVHDVKQAIVGLPHIGDVWPARWSEVRAALEQNPRNYIDHDEYLAICSAAGVPRAQADVLSGYLHLLGVILHFHEDPILRRIVILKPEWGTNAVYAVLDTKTIQERSGKFAFQDLAAIWGHTTYPESKHAELLQLMIRFELCFQLEGSNEYIAPELLSPAQPPLDWEEAGALRFEYQYDFMPAGIMTRFIARNHSLIEGRAYWRNGVLLAWENTRALVIAEALNRKIRISVVGQAKKELLAIVRRELQQIHRTLNSPDVRQMIPCICDRCQAGDPFFFDYQRVRGYHDHGVPEIRCDKSYRTFSPEQLLSGVFTRSEFDKIAAPEGRTMYVQNYYENVVKPPPPPTPVQPPRPNPWSAGSFYLVSLMILLTLIAAVAKLLPWWSLPLVIIAGLLAVTVVGALQLANDGRLSEEGFLKLMALAFRQLPLLKQVIGPPK